MTALDRSVRRTVELALAVAVLAIVVVLTTDFPVTYPAWPTLGGFPVNPELVVPGLLGLVTLVGAVSDGLGAGSLVEGVAALVVGVLGAITLLLASASLHTLYIGTAGGIFGGGILTLSVGIPLALVVVLRRPVGTAAGVLVSALSG
ncbi:hypothetical protein [Halorussus lipolyticus]|uniref:hypothetical protein n=1 Tax=Halorussus lipolyticus TaxID=3034024 RepID=UPI0023E844F9|nr:hypothetical protein [Halorussus sp. DT80]